MLALRKTQHAETAAVPDRTMLVSADILSSFPWPKALILLGHNSILSKDRNDLVFLSSFIESQPVFESNKRVCIYTLNSEWKTSVRIHPNESSRWPTIVTEIIASLQRRERTTC